MSTTATDQGLTLTGDDLATVRRLADLAVIHAASTLCTPDRDHTAPSTVDLSFYGDLYSVSRAQTALEPVEEPGGHFWPLDAAMVAGLRGAAQGFVRSGELSEAERHIDPWAAEMVERGTFAAHALGVLDTLENAA